MMPNAEYACFDIKNPAFVSGTNAGFFINIYEELCQNIISGVCRLW